MKNLREDESTPFQLRYVRLVERREGQRVQVWFPVQLDAEQLRARVAVSRDVSSRGCLLSTATTIAPGSKVSVTFHVPGETLARKIDGHVVRVEKNEDDPGGLWPVRVAIEFDEPVAELENQLIAADTQRRIQIGRSGS